MGNHLAGFGGGLGTLSVEHVFDSTLLIVYVGAVWVSVIMGDRPPFLLFTFLSPIVKKVKTKKKKAGPPPWHRREARVRRSCSYPLL